MVITGKGSNGTTYNIGSEKGQSFVNNAAVGDKMAGGDGSTWTKNRDGPTTISKDGTTWTVSAQASGSGALLGSSGSGNAPSTNSLYGTYNANPSYDYSAALSSLMKSGSTDFDTIESLINQRTAKALSTDGLGQYANDAFARSAREYITAGRANEWQKRLEEMANSQNSAYAQALVAQQAANLAAVQKAVSGLESQKTEVNNAYSDLYRQAYIDKMNAKKNIDQSLAARGITGGAAESTLLGLNTAYSDALRRAEQERISGISDLDRAISDARLTGDIENAQAAADSIREQTAARSELLQKLINRYDSLAAQQTAYDRADAQRAEAYAREDAQNSQAWARQIAQAMLAQSVMPDDETLAAAGMTRAQAAALLPQAMTGGGSYFDNPTEADTIIAALAAATGMDEYSIRSLWNAGYDFSEYADILPVLKNYLRGIETGSGPTNSSIGIQSATYGGSDVAGNMANLDYSPDEGVFTWNGKRYNSAEALSNDLNAFIFRGVITPAVEAEIKRKLAMYGFDA